jgi:hypothetical protein
MKDMIGLDTEGSHHALSILKFSNNRINLLFLIPLILKVQSQDHYNREAHTLLNETESNNFTSISCNYLIYLNTSKPSLIYLNLINILILPLKQNRSVVEITLGKPWNIIPYFLCSSNIS